MATSRIFRNTANHSDDYNKILTLSDGDITTVYNMYGAYVENDDFDSDEPESDENPRFVEFHDEMCYADADGTILRFVGHHEQVEWGKTLTFYTDNTGTAEFSPTESGDSMSVYLNWDGSNYQAITLQADHDYVEWEEVTDEFGNNWEENLQEIAATKWNFGKRTVLHTDGKKLYLEAESQFAGAIDLYEEIELYYCCNDTALELIKSGEELDEVRFEGGELGEDTVITVFGFDGVYVLLERGNDDQITVYQSEAKALIALHERAAELFSIIEDKQNFDPTADI